MGMMLKNLVNPYIQSTTVLCDQKQAVEDIAINVSVSNIQCDCHRSIYITVIIILMLWPCWECLYRRP